MSAETDWGVLVLCLHFMAATTPLYHQHKLEHENTIQAYAKLQGEDFVFYMQKLQITLGRSAQDPSRSDVDVHLGWAKIISRVHARIQFNFVTNRFELICYGKNGVYVDSKFYDNNSPAVPLFEKTLIQIGEKCFYFLLPSAAKLEQETYPVVPVTAINPPMIENVVVPKIIKRQSEERDSSEEYNVATDYSSGKKPPYSYASLIAQAINASDDKKITLSGIYDYVQSKYPYYRNAPVGWQNSIRHNLSLNKAFIRVPKCEDAPGKGAFWTIQKDFEMYFRRDGHYKCKRGKTLKTSGVNKRYEEIKNIQLLDVSMDWPSNFDPVN